MDTFSILRQELHQYPEVSGEESETARRIVRFMDPLGPDRTYTGLGGNGVAFVFSGQLSGPTVLLRCELDALPIHETSDLPYRSVNDGVSHKCGHDGHMAILASVATELASNRPRKGKAVLLFQPAEENGAGALKVLEDERFSEITPDFVFALHNLPGFPMGEVVVGNGPFCCASCGMVVELKGTTAHAAQPETGRSPAQAMCEAISEFGDLKTWFESGDELAFATVVGAQLGNDNAFGVAPGTARVLATLRSETSQTMSKIVQQGEARMRAIATRRGLECEIRFSDDFPATVNCPNATNSVRQAASQQQIKQIEEPFRWSEDFGHFTSLVSGALFGIGAGVDSPDLHHPEYDFPDSLIESGSRLFCNILRQYLY